MATISAILQLVNLVQGESSYGDDTNWGDVTDRNFSRLEKALGEVTAKTLTGSDVLLTADEELSSLILLSGALVANVAVETSGRKGFWMVKNACTGDYTVTFKTDAGAGVVIPQGGSALVTSNGTDIVPITLTRASGAGARTKYALKASGYTAVPSDDGAFFECSATLTLAFKPAALLGDQWVCLVMANGGAVTINPDASELINGAATLVIPDGSFAIVVCTGTAFRAVTSTSLEVIQAAVQASMLVPPWVPLSTANVTDPNMNTYLTAGWQHRVEFTTGAIANAPPSAGLYHALVIKTNDTRLTQILIPYSSISSRNIWVRNIAATDWGPWRSVPWSDDVLLLIGGVMTGALTLSGNPSSALHAAPKQYVDGHQGMAKAWVNFNGGGTIAIRDSFNVSSITDNGVGDYTVNFATAMPNANYAVSFTVDVPIMAGPGLASVSAGIHASTAPSTTAVRLNSRYLDTNVSAGARDVTYAHVAIHGD
jgi:hypothetical protein